jgi:ABC-type uncharacterized transport system involved in gliding motility auxiliary subunit
MVMQEPVLLTQFEGQEDPMTDYLAEKWGILMQDDILIDTTSQQPFAPYAAMYGNHAITQPIQSITSQYPGARSVRAEGLSGDASLVELVLTSDQSWAETDLDALADNQSQVSFDEGVDLLGPVSLAVAADLMTSDGRLVVFGDSDFVSNDNFVAYANVDVFMNSVDWMAGEEELISLTPKETTQRTVIPPQTYVLNLVFLVIVIVLPGLALIAGIAVLIQRQRRG